MESFVGSLDSLNNNIAKHLEKDSSLYRRSVLINAAYKHSGYRYDSILQKESDREDSITLSAQLAYSKNIEDLKRLPSSLTDGVIKIDSAANYFIYGIFVLVFGVLTSFYRFHVKEAAKYEHFVIGFHRISIAGTYSTTKFDDEVKASLARDAFLADQKMSKQSKVESPIPGHPTSDIGTALANKLLEGFDVLAKPKGQSSNQI
jgi:hypothetical protein